MYIETRRFYDSGQTQAKLHKGFGYPRIETSDDFDTYVESIGDSDKRVAVGLKDGHQGESLKKFEGVGKMKTQKELKELYRQELEKVEKGRKYIDYLVKDAEYIFEFGGKFYKIERPRIKKEFCYSHGFCGITSEEEKKGADDMVEVARTDKEYFKDENLKDLLEMVEKLEDVKKQAGYKWAEGSGPEYRVESHAKWGKEDGGHVLREWYLIYCYRYAYKKEPSGEVMPVEFIDELLRGYAVVLESFNKRLDTYLKKYGLSKVRSWSYLSD